MGIDLITCTKKLFYHSRNTLYIILASVIVLTVQLLVWLDVFIIHWKFIPNEVVYR